MNFIFGGHKKGAMSAPFLLLLHYRLTKAASNVLARPIFDYLFRCYIGQINRICP
jgi:hypothetical protein